MDYTRTPSTDSRLSVTGIAYGILLYVFLGLVMILEPSMRGGYWRGWEIISRGLLVTAVALVVAGISLLTRILLRHLPSRSKGNLSGEAPLYSSVWDQQLDG